MRTGFTEAQRRDPRIRAADDILRKCVHCGFCAPACPTYRLTGDELDGPRGRIWLMRDLLEAGGAAPEAAGPAADPGVVAHLDRCLGCLACMPACPSGVDYRSLIGIGREVIEARARRGWWDRTLRAALGRILPDPGLFAALLRIARPLAPLGRIIGGRIGAGLALAAGARVRQSGDAGPGVYPSAGERRGRVALITGCAQSALAPDINAALIRILNRAGIEAVVLPGVNCCGALNEHLGQADMARAHALGVISRALAEADGRGVDALLQTASGCGTFMKSYGGLFHAEERAAEPARRLAGLVRDAGEYLAGLDLVLSPAPDHPVRRIAWQAPCSLANGQGGAGYGRALLARAGFDVVEPPEGPVCCGSAGTYNLTEPAIADRLGADKGRALDGLGADVVVSSNLGCMMQLAPHLGTPVVHLVELLDWAQGGPRPHSLGALPAADAGPPQDG
ncbi:MAG: glycolate oxidase subunit GlcF [Alphaproteobacteria bacterium]|nr:glycolate oxidase subunit GlcF [Alphaproteobacteria bacterium]